MQWDGQFVGVLMSWGWERWLTCRAGEGGTVCVAMHATQRRCVWRHITDCVVTMACCVHVGNSSTWFDTACVVTNVRNFPRDRGTVVSTAGVLSRA